MLRKSVKLASVTTAVGSIVYVSSDKQRYQAFNRSLSASYRIANLLQTVAGISIDYGYNLYFKSNQKSKYDKFQTKLNDLQAVQDKQEQITFLQWKTKNTKEIKRLQRLLDENRIEIDKITEEIARMRIINNGRTWLSHIHTRSARKLTKMCQENKGVYIKLGQHLAMLDHIIPDEYKEELSVLLSQNPHSDLESVRRTFYDEFQKYPEELFDYFEATPIASASLAQVHVAYIQGVKYAVKVQHEGLSEGSTADRLVITFIVDLLARVFKGFDYKWLTREMNTNLPQELNFNVEKENIKKCTKHLQKLIDSGDIAIPEVNEELSTKKILTMKFEDGVYVSNNKAIDDMKLNRSDIARLISTTFYEQIFRSGFVHCDPHEANLLVRQHPKKKGRPQLVLLDHGLYKQLDDDFRRNYCRLWRAIVSSNENDIRDYCAKLNAGELFSILAAMLTMRSWDDITSADLSRLKRGASAAEAEKLKFYARRYFNEILSLLGRAPSELLLLLKTNDCLRHLDKELGSPVNTAIVIAGISADVILHEDISTSYSVGGILSTVLEYCNIQLRVYSLVLAELVLSFTKLSN